MDRLCDSHEGLESTKSAIQARWRKRPLPDRKADIAYEEIIVRRSNRIECPLSDLQADLGHGSNERPGRNETIANGWSRPDSVIQLC